MVPLYRIKKLLLLMELPLYLRSGQVASWTKLKLLLHLVVKDKQAGSFCCEPSSGFVLPTPAEWPYLNDDPWRGLSQTPLETLELQDVRDRGQEEGEPIFFLQQGWGRCWR